MSKRKPKQTDWTELNRQIFDKLDMLAEFSALGIDISGRDPKENGWIEAHAVGREDNSPSAAVNVITGRYRDLGGDGLALSFYDLAVHLKRFTRWQDARDHYAAKAGVSIGENVTRDPAEHLVFQNWSDGLAGLWCSRHKPGVTVESLWANGARLARYRDQYTVIALPVYGPGFTAADPTGWVLYNITGKELPVFHGKDKQTGKSKIDWKKMKTTSGSEGGLIGQWAIDRLTATNADPAKQLIWKVEGPSDLLALWAIIPADKREQHLVLTNSDGATSPPKPWMQTLFAGRRVAIVGDADIPGQKGAVLWASWACKVAGETRVAASSNLDYLSDKETLHHDAD
jgi:hypothetical protein